MAMTMDMDQESYTCTSTPAVSTPAPATIKVHKPRQFQFVNTQCMMGKLLVACGTNSASNTSMMIQNRRARKIVPSKRVLVEVTETTAFADVDVSTVNPTPPSPKREKLMDEENDRNRKARKITPSKLLIEATSVVEVSTVNPPPPSPKYSELMVEEKIQGEKIDTEDEETKVSPKSNRKGQLSRQSEQRPSSTPTNARVVKMVLESTEEEPDMEVLRDGLEQTFRERREWMEKQVPYINAVIRAYPALTFPEMLEFEFKKLTNADLTILRDKLTPRLKVYFESSDRYRARKITKNFPLCQRSYDMLRCTDLEPESNEYIDLRNAVGLLFLWHERVSKIRYGNVYRFLKVRNDTENETRERKVTKRRLPGWPYILILKGKLIDKMAKGRDRMVLFAEHNEILRSNNFFNSMLQLYLIYSVFLLEYNTSVRDLFDYFDELLEIGPKGKFVCSTP